jgi:prepilin-type N-terminal cleavage/methylation domain-containing protein
MVVAQMRHRMVFPLRSSALFRSRAQRGFSLMEIMLVVALTGVIGAIAVPMMANSLAFFRLSGDARSASNATALAKMRAASVFGHERVFVNLTARNFHLETWDKTTSKWIADGGTTSLSQNVRFSFGAVGTAPPNTQGVIGQSPACKNDLGTADIAGTACVIFNSRGLPIDPAGQPTVHAVYLTDGTAVYSVTVSATGTVRSWKTPPIAVPTWSLQ